MAIKYEALVKKNKVNDKAFARFSINKFASNVVNICSPLTTLGIQSFCYCKFNHTKNSLVCFTNIPEYPKIYLANDGLPLDPYLSLHKKLPAGLYTNIWQRGFQINPAQRFVSKLNELKPLKDGCSFIRNNAQGDRIVFHLSSFTSDNITTFDALEIFTYYFENAIAPLLLEAEEIVLPNYKDFWKPLMLQKLYLEDRHKVAAFLQKINFTYYRCMLIAKKHHLSLREMQCVYMIIQGKNAQQIAGELSLSSRTVESYIENLKIKLNCDTKLQLVIKLLTSMW